MSTTLTNKDNLNKLKKQYKGLEETRNRREGYTNISGLEGLKQNIAIESQKFKEEDTKFLEILANYVAHERRQWNTCFKFKRKAKMRN